MRAILLDTSAYSAFMNGHPEVKLALQHADQIYLSPITTDAHDSKLSQIMVELFPTF